MHALISMLTSKLLNYQFSVVMRDPVAAASTAIVRTCNRHARSHLPRRFSRPLAIRVLVFFLITTFKVSAAPITPGSDEAAARSELSRLIPNGKLLWVNNKKIHFGSLGNWRPRTVTKKGHEEYRPRWSPDGRKIVFQRGDSSVYIMNSDFTHKLLVLSGAHTPDWTGDGRAVTGISTDGYRVLKYDLATKQTSVVYDARQRGYNGQRMSQTAELHVSGRYLLTFREQPTHATEIIDLEQQRYLANPQMLRGDCKPSWSPDGSYLLTTARTGSRPVLRADFDAKRGKLGPSRHFVGIDTILRYWAHDGRVSNDGKWVVFSGKILIGPGMFGKREIYIWNIGGNDADAVRLTFETGDDLSPSLFVSGPAA